jgi:hypothetical protein
MISGTDGTEHPQVIDSHRTLDTGYNRVSPRPTKGYKPAQGLIRLFSKTGTRRRNPTPHRLTTTPTNIAAPPRRSYVEVLCTKMDDGGKYGNISSNGAVGSGAGRFRGRGQGEGFARQDYQRSYQRYGHPGFYAGRGGGRRYEQRGRGGFGGRQPDFRMGFGVRRNRRHLTGKLGPICMAKAWSRGMSLAAEPTGLPRGQHKSKELDRFHAHRRPRVALRLMALPPSPHICLSCFRNLLNQWAMRTW